MATQNQGVCIWFTGRSGAGKSTVCNALVPLLEDAGRTVSVLDVVPILAKSPCERTSEGKLLRKAFVAGEVARHGGVAICVTVSARREVRDAARAMVGPERFVEIFADIPPEVSARRKAARNKKPPLLKRMRRIVRRTRAFGGGKSAYQEPQTPDLTIDTVSVTPERNAAAILDLLTERGFVSSHHFARGEPDRAQADRATSR